MEVMKAMSFMYVRPPGYNAESAKAAEIEDEKKRSDVGDIAPGAAAASTSSVLLADALSCLTMPDRSIFADVLSCLTMSYNDALSMLSQMTAETDDDLKERSASIQDIFLHMILFPCMSGNVDKAISRIFGILPTATHDNAGDKLLADVLSCLTMSDRCIFWISCLYAWISVDNQSLHCSLAFLSLQ